MVWCWVVINPTGRLLWGWDGVEYGFGILQTSTLHPLGFTPFGCIKQNSGWLSEAESVQWQDRAKKSLGYYTMYIYSSPGSLTTLFGGALCFVLLAEV